MFSKDLELTIGQCYREARERRHEFMTVEHLLLALLENPSAAAVLRAEKELTLDALAVLLYRLAQREPLVLAIENLHWADPTTLELATLLTDAGRRERMSGEARRWVSRFRWEDCVDAWERVLLDEAGR